MSEGVGPSGQDWRGSKNVPQALRDAWLADGLVVLPGLVPPGQVDRHNAMVAALRAEVPNGPDDHGHGDRIGQLHQRIPELVDTVASEQLLSFLSWALADDPLLFASLNFERGTQQESHIDLIYFCTEPLYAMAGVWVALEDIHADAGPLFYHLGSHYWDFPYGADTTLDAPIDERANEWLRSLGQRVDQKGSEKTPILLRKGDALVWHAKLAHGGSVRNNPVLSRKSAVYHFIGANSRLYTFDEFFTHPKEQLLRREGMKVPVRRRGIVSYQRYPYFVTYHEGKEIVHNL